MQSNNDCECDQCCAMQYNEMLKTETMSYMYVLMCSLKIPSSKSALDDSSAASCAYQSNQHVHFFARRC